MAFDRLPENAVDTLTKYCVDDHEDLTASQNLILKEHLCWSTYFSAKAAFDRWFDHHNKEKPKCPDESKLTQHLTKQVTHEKQTIQYNIALEQWKATQNSLAKEANEKITAVITFSGMYTNFTNFYLSIQFFKYTLYIHQFHEFFFRWLDG